MKVKIKDSAYSFSALIEGKEFYAVPVTNDSVTMYRVVLPSKDIFKTNSVGGDDWLFMSFEVEVL